MCNNEENMDRIEAIGLLQSHAGIADGPRLRNGIVGALRPFIGIQERNFHEVMECVFLLHEELGSDEIDTRIPHSLLTIVATVTGWAILPNSMLRRNGLINEQDLGKLTSWISIIGSTSIRYMRKLSHSVALSAYLEYLFSTDVGNVPHKAAFAAIKDSFNQDDEDLKVIAIDVCSKFRGPRDQFSDQIAKLSEQNVGRELGAAILNFQQSLAK